VRETDTSLGQIFTQMLNVLFVANTAFLDERIK